MTNLASRLAAMMAHLDKAAAAYHGAGSHDDDGKARSLGNDLGWLRDRVAERLATERETGGAASPSSQISIFDLLPGGIERP